MSECILVNGSGKQRLIDAAISLGCKVRPRELIMCEACRNGHIVEIENPVYDGELFEIVDPRYGMAPSDPADETGTREKPDTYVARSYCRTCFAYHSAEQTCPGERPPVVDWTKKEI